MSNKDQKPILIKMKDFLGQEELYTDFFECPKCKTESPVWHTKFCRGCGRPVEFSDDVLRKTKASF